LSGVTAGFAGRLTGLDVSRGVFSPSPNPSRQGRGDMVELMGEDRWVKAQLAKAVAVAVQQIVFR